MKIVIDTTAGTLTQAVDGSETSVGLYTKTAFEALSREWVRVGWSLKYYHNFSWFGLPILQLPEDLLRLQEVVYELRPDLIVETGVFRGGSLLFHATLCQALGYDLNTVEFAVQDGVPYAIDFMNPAPDADYHSVGPENFEWIVDAVADLAIEQGLAGPRVMEELRWAKFLNPESKGAGAAG